MWSVSNPHPAGKERNSTSHNWASFPSPPPLPVELKLQGFTKRESFGENPLIFHFHWSLLKLSLSSSHSPWRWMVLRPECHAWTQGPLLGPKSLMPFVQTDFHVAFHIQSSRSGYADCHRRTLPEWDSYNNVLENNQLKGRQPLKCVFLYHPDSPTKRIDSSTLNSNEMHVLGAIKMTLSQSRRERWKEMNIWVIEYRKSDDSGWRTRIAISVHSRLGLWCAHGLPHHWAKAGWPKSKGCPSHTWQPSPGTKNGWLGWPDPLLWSTLRKHKTWDLESACLDLGASAPT